MTRAAALPSGIPPRALLFVVVLAVFLANCYLASSVPLIDPDEGRNAEIAREMAVSGDFLIPHLAGMPYLDKPPGLFWAEALSMKAFGYSPRSARLPVALAAAATVWLIGLLGLRLADRGRALYGMVLLVSAPLFLGLSTFVIFDMPLTLCVTLFWTLLAREVVEGPSRGGRIGLFAAIAAGLFIKGPVMLAWAIGGSLAAAMVLRSTATIRWIPRWRGWAFLLLVVGGWFAAASQRCPEFPHYAFIEETIERTTTGSFHRQQPLWFIPVVLLIGSLPWSVATPWTRRLGLESRVALGFVLFALVFFSLSSSKLATYPLPALPALAWIASEAWLNPLRSRRGAWALAATYLFAALIFLAAPHLDLARGGRSADLLRRVDGSAGTMLVVGLAAVSLAAAAGALSRRSWLVLATVPAFSVMTFATVGPALGFASGAPLAEAIRNHAPGGTVRFERCWSPGVDFLLGRRSQIISHHGHETTSTYQDRYHETLMRRGEWTLLSARPEPDTAAVVVRSFEASDPDSCPRGFSRFYQDERFVACGRDPEDPEVPSPPADSGQT